MPKHDDPIEALECEAQLVAALVALMRREALGPTWSESLEFAHAEILLRKLGIDWRIADETR